MKRFCFILFCTVICLPIFAQESIEEMERKLHEKATGNDEKIALLDNLSWEYLNTDLAKAAAYADAGVRLARKQRNTQMEITLLRNLGVAEYMQGNFEHALKIYDEALLKARKIEDIGLQARVLGAIGNLYNETAEPDSALSYYQQAIDLHQLLGETGRVGIIAGNIGAMFANQLNHGRAKPYQRQALEIATQRQDTLSMAIAHLNLGIGCEQLGQPGEALSHLGQAKELARAAQAPLIEARALSSLAVRYEKSGAYEKARTLAQQALELAQNVGSQQDVSEIKKVLATLLIATKRPAEAVQLLQPEIRLTDSTNHIVRYNIYYTLSRAYARLNRADSTERYLSLALDMLQKNNDHASQQALAAQQAKYETEKKELRIAALEKEQKLYIVLFGVSILGLLLLILALYLRGKTIKTKRQLAEEQILKLQQEKQLVATQAVLDGESAERSRLARDLHDGLGGMLSAVKLNLFDMKQNVILQADDVSAFNRAVEMLDKSIGELRRVAHNMMPEALSLYGLKTAADNFCRSFPNVRFFFFGEEHRLQSQTETTLYRVLLELVNNAVKHSGAEYINVQIVQHPDHLSMIVHDNGKGFNPALSTQGMGLKNITNRLQLEGGTMKILSGNDGTEAIVDINTENKRL